MSLLFDQTQLNNICVNNGIFYLGLFGSYARGEENSKSDVDLLVKYSPESKVKSLLDHVGVQLEFEDLLDKPVDLIEEHTLKPRVKPYVERDLKVLYER